MLAVLRLLLLLLASTVGCISYAQDTCHIWEMREVSLQAESRYNNPYVDVKVWIELKGPGFEKRIYGFWDGGQNFKVRFTTTTPGRWSWTSGADKQDAGLLNKSGELQAISWTEKELEQNPLRRGFIRASANQHALIHADSTPYLAIGDTWFALSSARFKWYNDDRRREIGPQAGFKDYVQLRKTQGFNWINIIAAFPNWKTDDSSWLLKMNDSARTTVRSAWMEFGTGSAKNMDNEGGRPFLFPGKVPGYENFFPDMDRINPAYFQELDKKILYLNENGFVPFIEASRRDASLLWSKYYEWPGSYTRFVQYIYSRYQAFNTILGPVHLDIIDLTISPDEYSAALKQMEEEYGPPPFGTLLSANANPSTLENWGENSWVTLHQIGNKREHTYYWYLTEIFYLKKPAPALNGEPYYSGYSDPRGLGAVNYVRGAKGGTLKDDALCRSGMYGSFLSGGLAGHVYGAEGIWGADIESSAPTKMWDAFRWNSGNQVQYLRNFAFSIGNRYQDLEPQTDLVSPSKTHELLSYEGWAYCARTADKNIYLLYFENGYPRNTEIRGAKLNSIYKAQWFDPRNGTWIDVGSNGRLASSNIGILAIDNLPRNGDWGLKLVYEGPQDPSLINKKVSYISPLKKNVRKLGYVAAALVVGSVLLFAFRRYRRSRRFPDSNDDAHNK